MARIAAALISIGAAVGLALAAAAPVSAADLEFFTGESLNAQCSAKAGDADNNQSEDEEETFHETLLLVDGLIKSFRRELKWELNIPAQSLPPSLEGEGKGRIRSPCKAPAPE